MSEVSAGPGRIRSFLALLGLGAAAAAALAVAGAAERGAPERQADRALVAALRLTDLALWSQASSCRHPSQADLFAPHAEHPAALEHFPAGSIVPPRHALGVAGGEGTGGR